MKVVIYNHSHAIHKHNYITQVTHDCVSVNSPLHKSVILCKFIRNPYQMFYVKTLHTALNSDLEGGPCALHFPCRLALSVCCGRHGRCSTPQIWAGAGPERRALGDHSAGTGYWIRHWYAYTYM